MFSFRLLLCTHPFRLAVSFVVAVGVDMTGRKMDVEAIHRGKPGQEEEEMPRSAEDPTKLQTA